jgi:two-component system, chemotaxis family, sensor kinase CheA
MLDYHNYKWNNEIFLVADDDFSSSVLLQKILNKTGATVISVNNGLRAVEKIKENIDISVAILDIVMPILDGYKVIELARKIRPDLIFIACTADVIRLNTEKCKNLGFAAYISKPVLPGKLFSVLEEALILRSQPLSE